MLILLFTKYYYCSCLLQCFASVLLLLSVSTTSISSQFITFYGEEAQTAPPQIIHRSPQSAASLLPLSLLPLMCPLSSRRQPLARHTQPLVHLGGDRLRSAGAGQAGALGRGRCALQMAEQPAEEGGLFRLHSGEGRGDTGGPGSDWSTRWTAFPLPRFYQWGWATNRSSTMRALNYTLKHEETTKLERFWPLNCNFNVFMQSTRIWDFSASFNTVKYFTVEAT